MQAVHPRRRGEHRSASCCRQAVYGSSPQARGTLRRPDSASAPMRFIPAGAGNTQRGADCCYRAAVHPRRRGEHASCQSSAPTSSGSSPQARGTLSSLTRSPTNPAVHPRRRGEHTRTHAYTVDTRGSSPQARGTHCDSAIFSAYERFIPAGAGNTSIYRCTVLLITVHPRRRGEHIISSMAELLRSGSSPQARGTPQANGVRRFVIRFIPAGAGNTRAGFLALAKIPVHPRRRGEHCTRMTRHPLPGGSSPQARGTRNSDYARRVRARFIPAGAGNTRPERRGTAGRAVHPRRRGEHGGGWGGYQITNGSSPQARGTPVQLAVYRSLDRFIPAGAGNTRMRQFCGPRRTVHPRRRGEHRARQL